MPATSECQVFVSDSSYAFEGASDLRLASDVAAAADSVLIRSCFCWHVAQYVGLLRLNLLVTVSDCEVVR